MGAWRRGREGLRAGGGNGRSGEGGGREARRALGQSEALVARRSADVSRRDQGPAGRQGGRRAAHPLRLPAMGVGQPAVQAQRPALEPPRRHGRRGWTTPARARCKTRWTSSASPAPTTFATGRRWAAAAWRSRRCSTRWIAHGVIARRDGIMDGMGCNYLHAIGGNKELFDNWMIQLRAWVKEERNHPSIFAWSMENELTLINARNCGQLKPVEPRITRAVQDGDGHGPHAAGHDRRRQLPDRPVAAGQRGALHRGEHHAAGHRPARVSRSGLHLGEDHCQREAVLSRWRWTGRSSWASASS